MNFPSKYLLLGAAGLLGVLALGGALVLSAGLAPVKASSGHWRISTALLQFAKKRAIATQSLPAKRADLSQPGLVVKGATHYETGCKPCHGSPGTPKPAVAAAMTPAPPDLASSSRQYDDEELFFVVKHGLKFTGMPAWPAQKRDDEVRAMVAFLREYPRLDARRYGELAFGDAPSTSAPTLAALDTTAELPPLVQTRCARCHGQAGLGRAAGAAPKLAGQKLEYLVSALRSYRMGQRYSGIMQPVAVALSREEQRQLAEYYSRLSPEGQSGTEPASSPSASAQGADPKRGEIIATLGVAAEGVPSCSDCHGPPAAERNPNYPSLAGQYAEYLVLQLELFKAKNRGGSPYAHLMEHVASRLNPGQMRDVAAYYASLPSEP